MQFAGEKPLVLHFKIRLFDQSESIVWHSQGLSILVAKGNYNFTSKQGVAVKWKLLLASMFMLSLLFKSLLQIKIEIESRLHSIDIYDDDSL